MKKLLSILLVLLVLFSLSACGRKLYSSNGLQIMLPDRFEEVESSKATVCYQSSVVTISANRQPISMLGDLTIEDYAELVCTQNALEPTEDISYENDLITMEFTKLDKESSTNYVYFCAVFKAPDAFWQVQFSCEESSYDNCKPSFISWAQTISFEESADAQ